MARNAALLELESKCLHGFFISFNLLSVILRLQWNELTPCEEWGTAFLPDLTYRLKSSTQSRSHSKLYPPILHVRGWLTALFRTFWLSQWVTTYRAYFAPSSLCSLIRLSLAFRSTLAGPLSSYDVAPSGLVSLPLCQVDMKEPATEPGTRHEPQRDP